MAAKKKKAPPRKPTSKQPTPKAAPKRPVRKKPAPKKPAPEKAKAAAKRRDVFSLVTIGITPPELAPDTPAYELNGRLANRSTRPTPEELADLPWLAQDRAYRAGYYLLTHGLRKHAGHPELELCNVPGAMLASAQGILNHLSDYVLNERAFSHGEVMMLSENPLAVVGFLKIAPQERGTVHDGDVLRVLFLR